MRKLNQAGIMNPLAIPLVLVAIVMLVASGLAISYYMQFVDQRDNNLPKIEAAVDEAKATQKQELNKEFAAREKEPYKSYVSPAELGSVRLVFPKTWSSYVVLGKSTDIDYFGHPNYVPSDNTNYALRMRVDNKSFATVLKAYDNQVKKGELSASAVRVAGTTGTRLDGFLEKDQKGSMVIFPLRDKTLTIWTESEDFRSDFDNIVIKSLTFVP